jgi:hypothetical protein
MVNPVLVNMLARKIRDAEVNPKTNEPYKLEDILISEYKTAVEEIMSL